MTTWTSAAGDHLRYSQFLVRKSAFDRIAAHSIRGQLPIFPAASPFKQALGGT